MRLPFARNWNSTIQLPKCLSWLPKLRKKKYEDKFHDSLGMNVHSMVAVLIVLQKGDGSNFVVTFAGTLLENAGELLRTVS